MSARIPRPESARATTRRAWLLTPIESGRLALELAGLDGIRGDGVDDEAVIEQVEIQAGYAERQHREIQKLQASERRAIPHDFDYAGLNGLSNELKEKLVLLRPATVGQAGRIEGMTPAAMSLLPVHLEGDRRRKRAC